MNEIRKIVWRIVARRHWMRAFMAYLEMPGERWPEDAERFADCYLTAVAGNLIRSKAWYVPDKNRAAYEAMVADGSAEKAV